MSWLALLDTLSGENELTYAMTVAYDSRPREALAQGDRPASPAPVRGISTATLFGNQGRIIRSSLKLHTAELLDSVAQLLQTTDGLSILLATIPLRHTVDSQTPKSWVPRTLFVEGLARSLFGLIWREINEGLAVRSDLLGKWRLCGDAVEVLTDVVELPLLLRGVSNRRIRL